MSYANRFGASYFSLPARAVCGTEIPQIFVRVITHYHSFASGYKASGVAVRSLLCRRIAEGDVISVHLLYQRRRMTYLISATWFDRCDASYHLSPRASPPDRYATGTQLVCAGRHPVSSRAQGILACNLHFPRGAATWHGMARQGTGQGRCVAEGPGGAHLLHSITLGRRDSVQKAATAVALLLSTRGAWLRYRTGPRNRIRKRERDLD